jgi:cell division protein FtsN
MNAKYLLVIIFFVFAACKSKEEKVELQVEVSPQDTVQIVEAPEPPPAPVEEPDKGVNLDDRYFLVVGTYTVKEFAETWEKKYQERGFKPEVIMRNEDGYYRLALQSFNDFDIAQGALGELRYEKEFQESWIMVINK